MASDWRKEHEERARSYRELAEGWIITLEEQRSYDAVKS